MSDTLFDALVTELGRIFAPITAVIEDPNALDGLLHLIGANGENAGGSALVTVLNAVADLANQIEQLADESSPSFASIAAVLEAAKKAFLAIRGLDTPGGPAAALEGLGLDLANLLIELYLWNWHPLAHEVAVLLTLIEPTGELGLNPAVTHNGKILRLPYKLDRFRFDRLSNLLSDPAAALRAEYGNPLATLADANAMAAKLFPRILSVLRGLGVSCQYGFDPRDAERLGDAAPFVDHALLIYANSLLQGADAEAGVILTISSADRGDLGFVFSPFGALTETFDASDWTIVTQLGADIQGFAVGRHGFTLLASPGTVQLNAKVTATLDAPESGPSFVIGSSNGSRIEVGGALLSVETTLSEASQMLAVAAEVSNSAIVIASGDGDGFLQSVLPSDGLRAKFDLGITWSNTKGLAFKGAAGMDATLPIGLSIGGALTVPSVHLGLQAVNTGIELEVSASVGLSIGPVQALVDRIGVEGTFAFPPDGGNLNVVDFAYNFKLPSGVGLSIDAAGVSGGGFLAHNDATHEYMGVLQLEFTRFQLQAFGLITTQVAGAAGYSLLALVDAEFPPVQLGWGFTLDGVGGLFAVHRTASTDALHAALKANTLSKILFPKSAITNAPQILATLDAIFPTAPGRFLFGPMALIGWGSPTILTAAIAVIIELPEPIRIVLIARLSANIPSESEALVRLNMDALGVLDLSQDSLSLDATLFDSKLLAFTLSGDMALRANWSSSSQREFLLAVGGFHPQFTPPAGFPALKRITIDMPSGSVSKLRLAAYLAITSNTLQFGAALDVFIGVSGFGLLGHLGFDALLQLDPFHFDADISGQVALTAGGDGLMSVGLNATLSGPAPWNIAGDFKVHIVFFDVQISFSHSWGDDAPVQPIAPTPVLPLLTAALADSRNWGAALPAGTPSFVSLKDNGVQLVHPLASLEVHESVVPLGLAIERFASAPVTGGNQFEINDYKVNGSTVDHVSIQDDFAPAQFFNLSEDEKLARPSFEQHDAGVRLTGVGLTVSGALVVKTISYETFYVDQAGGALRTDPVTPPKSFPLDDLQFVLATGASGRATIRTVGNQRYSAPGTPVKVASQNFVVADRNTLAAVAIPSQGSTYSDAQAALKAALAASPARRTNLQVVATHETSAV
jgi:hypothetical protein